MKSQSASSQLTAVAGTLIAVYLFGRMVADPYLWRNISEYYSFAFEAAFILVASVFFRGRVTLWSRLSRTDLGSALLSFAAGYAAFRGAVVFGVPIPFEFSSGELVFLLLVLGPVVEESIFRLALWESICVVSERFARKTGVAHGVTLVATTLLFAVAHFQSYWFVPEQFRGFVIYQTCYVVILGGLAGWRRFSTNSFAPALLVHFAFNLGFYCAYLL